MKAITQVVLDNKADLQIIFDTDVDRSAAVDSTGCELNRNRQIALMSAIVLEEHPGTTIVTDSVSLDGLTVFIENTLGGKHHRFKRGYKKVIDEGIRLTSLVYRLLGALKENHWLHDCACNMSRVSGYGEWFLLRLSLNDPVLPLDIEVQNNEDAVKLGLAVLAAQMNSQLSTRLPWTNLTVI